MTERPSLLDLSELEDDLVPEILPSSASLSVKAKGWRFRELFSRAAGVSPLREIVPGTAYALLEAIPATVSQVAFLRITASDGEQTVSLITEGADIKVPGSVLLPPKRVHDILKLAPTEDIDITVVGPTALIRSGRARWTVQVPEGEISDLTDLEEVGNIALVPVPVPAFLGALKAVQVAASTTNARVSLMQVLLKDAAIVATDGGRLHRAPVPGLDGSLATTVPIGVVAELLRSLGPVAGNPDEVMEFGYDDQNLVFRINGDVIVAKKMLLHFPDVSSLLMAPRVTNSLNLVVDRAELLRAVERVRINADPDVSVVTLATVRGIRSADDWLLEVRSRDRSGNTAQEVMDCQWSGKAMEVSYNHHHLTDLLAVCVDSDLVFKLGVDTKSSKTPLYVEDTESGLIGIVQQVTQHWA